MVAAAGVEVVVEVVVEGILAGAMAGRRWASNRLRDGTVVAP
jgi:hypothetical protein